MKEGEPDQDDKTREYYMLNETININERETWKKAYKDNVKKLRDLENANKQRAEEDNEKYKDIRQRLKEEEEARDKV